MFPIKLESIEDFNSPASDIIMGWQMGLLGESSRCFFKSLQTNLYQNAESNTVCWAKNIDCSLQTRSAFMMLWAAARVRWMLMVVAGLQSTLGYVNITQIRPLCNSVLGWLHTHNMETWFSCVFNTEKNLQQNKTLFKVSIDIGVEIKRVKFEVWVNFISFWYHSPVFYNCWKTIYGSYSWDHTQCWLIIKWSSQFKI